MVVNEKICFLYAVIVPADANQLNLDSLARTNYKKFQQSPAKKELMLGIKLYSGLALSVSLCFHLP